MYHPDDGTVLLKSHLRSRDRVAQLFDRFGQAVLGSRVRYRADAFDLEPLKSPARLLPDAAIVPIAISLSSTRSDWDRLLAPLSKLVGPRTLVVKRGEYGAILFAEGCQFMAPGYLLEDVFDPTGAGDCFAGGFIGYLAERDRLIPDGHRRS